MTKKNYWLHKLNGLCTKCNNKAKYSVYCYEHWLWSIFNNIKYRCGNPYNKQKDQSYKDKRFLFTRREFIDWGLKNEPVNLKRPSIDRIENNKDYTLDNIQFLELKENIIKDKTTFTTTHGKCYSCKLLKPIDQFTKDNRRSNGYTSICRLCESIRCRTKNQKVKEIQLTVRK